MPEPSTAPTTAGSLEPRARLWGSWRLRHLPTVLTASFTVLAFAAVAGGVTGGTPAAIGAGVGVALVIASYLVSTLVVAWADSVQTSLVFPLGMMTYLIKCTVLGGAMLVAAGSEWPGLVPLGLGVAAGVLAWTTAQVWWTVRHGPPGSSRRTDTVVRSE